MLSHYVIANPIHFFKAILLIATSRHSDLCRLSDIDSVDEICEEILSIVNYVALLPCLRTFSWKRIRGVEVCLLSWSHVPSRSHGTSGNVPCRHCLSHLLGLARASGEEPSAPALRLVSAVLWRCCTGCLPLLSKFRREPTALSSRDCKHITLMKAVIHKARQGNIDRPNSK
jgi:hypothetical protein